MKKVLLASNNSGKVQELQALLKDVDVEVMPTSALVVPTVEETGITFVENALIKARHAAQFSGFPAIADDSGLEVDALDGAPGIYSARYAGIECNDQANMERLLKDLSQVPVSQRSARFHCVLVYLQRADDPCPLIAQGTWEGLITSEPRGNGGFGYDPIFFVPETQCTAAELTFDVKNRLSHRAKALKILVSLIRNHLARMTFGDSVP